MLLLPDQPIIEGIFYGSSLNQKNDGFNLNGTHESTFNIFPLRMKTGPGGKYIPDVSCASWRVIVEAHNIINRKTVPQECEEYVGNYMLGDQYRADSKFVNREGFFYARTLNLKERW
ncbi:putative Acid phosphatase [Medicago truncatula]|uniref:Acid phosphatase n=1 Tax=Medicago truncatula TaxID=3880 RepID=A0A072U1K1_MEDTR|nr:acid phosphatase [Medicago truncatula]RHN40621.1 putative Acid phosphatase [Medicago truncatula]